LSAPAITLAMLIKHMRILTATPLFEQIRRISQNYMKPLIAMSPINSLMVNPQCTDSILQRDFVNGSILYQSYAFTSVTRCRGIACDAVQFDEIDDFDPEYVNCTARTHYVHRLVAEAFIPNPDNLPEVNHKDEDRFNNHADNLEWRTRGYNQNYGTVVQRIRKTSARTRGRAIIQMDLNGNEIQKFPSLHEAGRQMGIGVAAIANVCLGKQKTSCGFTFKFADCGGRPMADTVTKHRREYGNEFLEWFDWCRNSDLVLSR
jgi:hypothetical protein